MDDAMADIKGRIPEFAGYEDEVARRRADEQIRAAVGEALAALRERFPDRFSADAGQAFDNAILRCEFMNQEAFKDFEYQTLDDAAKARIAQADQGLLRAAAQTQEAGAGDVLACVQSVLRAFDERDAALSVRSQTPR